MFFVILGARLWLIDQFSSAVPYLDEWNGEAEVVLVPWLNGTLRPADLWLPHNEHRIVLTRLESLLLLIANRQWDPQLEAVCNAIFQAASLTLLAAIFRRFASRGASPIVVGSFILLGAPPVGWENTLVGFQSQVYFLIFFSMVALLGLGTCAPLSGRWWLGLAAVVLACLSQASGFFAAVCVLGFILLDLSRDRFKSFDRAALITILVCLTFVVAAFLTRIKVPGHAVFQAESPIAFAISFARCLAWPWSDRPWMSVLIYLPFGCLLWRNLTGGSAASARWILLVGGWVILQAAAMAWARGGPGNVPASRYTDILALGLIANLCAVLHWIETIDARASSRCLARTVATGWVGAVLAGLLADSRASLAFPIPAFRDMVRRQESLIRRYVLTGDAALLQGKSYPEIPYPDATMIIRMLDVAALRDNLPTSLRVPLPSAATSPPAPSRGDLPSSIDASEGVGGRELGRLSHWSNVLRRNWQPLVVTGVALLAASLLIELLSGRHPAKRPPA